jgi:hypothetical protein
MSSLLELLIEPTGEPLEPFFHCIPVVLLHLEQLGFHVMHFGTREPVQNRPLGLLGEPSEDQASG